MGTPLGSKGSGAAKTANSKSVRSKHSLQRFGPDALWCVSEYLDPLDYCSVSKFFLRTAEDRAETLLRKTERKCFEPGSTASPSSCDGRESKALIRVQHPPPSLSLESKRWRRRLERSVHKPYRARSWNGNSFSPYSSAYAGKRSPPFFEPSSGGKRQRTDFPSATPARLLWNRANRVPLASTHGYVKGPSVLLPDRKHLAFFDDLYCQIVIVSVDQGTTRAASFPYGAIVAVLDAQEFLPDRRGIGENGNGNGDCSTHRLPVRADLRLFCTEDGHLVLYYCREPDPDRPHEPREEHGGESDSGANATSNHSTSTSPSSTTVTHPESSRHAGTSSLGPKNEAKLIADDDDDNEHDPHHTHSTPVEASASSSTPSANFATVPSTAQTCWFSLCKLSAPRAPASTHTTDQSTSPAEHWSLQHAHFCMLDQSNHTDIETALPPIQEMAMCSSSGTIVVLRYNRSGDVEEDRSDTEIVRSSSNNSSFNHASHFWIQTFSIFSGTLVREQRVPLVSLRGEDQYHQQQHWTNSDPSVTTIRHSHLSIVHHRHHDRDRVSSARPHSAVAATTTTADANNSHVLLTLYCDDCSASGTVRHYTFSTHNLEPVDCCQIESDSETNVGMRTDTMPFAQHAGSRILYGRVRRRHFSCDPKDVSISWTGSGSLMVSSDGSLQRAKAVLSPSCAKTKSNTHRWKIRCTLPGGDTALMEDPDEDTIILDEVHLATGRLLRSISTGVSRKESMFAAHQHRQRQRQHFQDVAGYEVDAIHCARSTGTCTDTDTSSSSNLQPLLVVLSSTEGSYRSSIVCKILSTGTRS